MPRAARRDCRHYRPKGRRLPSQERGAAGGPFGWNGHFSLGAYPLRRSPKRSFVGLRSSWSESRVRLARSFFIPAVRSEISLRPGFLKNVSASLDSFASCPRSASASSSTGPRRADAFARFLSVALTSPEPFARAAEVVFKFARVSAKFFRF